MQAAPDPSALQETLASIQMALAKAGEVVRTLQVNAATHLHNSLSLATVRPPSAGLLRVCVDVHVSLWSKLLDACMQNSLHA
jgi:hypothetical protein